MDGKQFRGPNNYWLAIVIAVLAVPVACSMKGAVTPGQITDCLDTRDGERFTIGSAKVSNVQVGLAGAATCFDAIDEDGKQHLGMCSDQEAWLKCVPRGTDQTFSPHEGK